VRARAALAALFRPAQCTPLRHLQIALEVEAQLGYINHKARARVPPALPVLRRCAAAHTLSRLASCSLAFAAAAAQGERTSFARFAEGTLAALARAPPPWAPADAAAAAAAAAADFGRYAAVAPPERARLARLAAALVQRSLRAWEDAPRAAGAAPVVVVAAAAVPPAAEGTVVRNTGGQRSPEWMDRRSRLLTASAFANSLGFFGGLRMVESWVRPSCDRAALGSLLHVSWAHASRVLCAQEERVGLRPPFEARARAR
jgi:hypothetical protein